jgi:aminoglycoside phosphotransferase (APT) family kinase protein
VEASEPLVRSLLESQHPDLAHLSLSWVGAGWDNFIFRLGEHLSVRLPRRAGAAQLIAHEQEWLPTFAASLTLPTPVPTRVGLPEHGFPWIWSVVPWFAGTASDQSEMDRNQVRRIAAFYRSLHVPAPENAPFNPYRGVPLSGRIASAEERLIKLEKETDLITPVVKRLWDRAVAAPFDAVSTWLHGDLHAQNVLVESGVITAVIDWGDVCRGDRASDLASVWMLLKDRETREELMRACDDVSDATWARARGWAILFGLVLVDTGRVSNPRHAAMGAETLRRVVDGP